MAPGIADPVARIVSSMFAQPLRRSPDGQGIIVGTDQALGYAATLGLSLAVYRLVAAMLRGNRRSVDDDDRSADDTSSSSRSILSLPSFLLTFLRAALFRKIRDGDSYHRAAYGRDNHQQKKGAGKKKGEDTAGPDMQHRGSCHCASIRFTVSSLFRDWNGSFSALCAMSQYHWTNTHFLFTLLAPRPNSSSLPAIYPPWTVGARSATRTIPPRPTSSSLPRAAAISRCIT